MVEDGEEMSALLRWAAETSISDSPSTSCPPSSSSSSSYSLGHSLSVSYFPTAGGRGLAAARKLKRGELILRVPRAALLTTDSVLSRDPKLAACVERHRHRRLSRTQILTICLLAEVGKGRASQWYPYLVQLPHSYDTLANFTNFETQALQVADAICVSHKAVSIAKSQWKEALCVLEELDLKSRLVKFRSWIWASATVSSRTLHIPWDDAGCLCPVGDLFNYAAPGEEIPEDLEGNVGTYNSYSNCCSQIKDESVNLVSNDQRLTDGGYEESMTSYCFYARQTYEQGEQVLLGYGTYTNLELLEHYGFLLSHNPNDKAFIQLDEEIYIASCWPKDSLYIQPDGSPSFALGCSLRLWATPKNLQKLVGHLIYSGSSVSAENEKTILKYLIKKCHDILDTLGSTVADDERLLEMMDKLCEDDNQKLTKSDLHCKEVKDFFLAHGYEIEDINNTRLPVKVTAYLRRWSLAVQWRLSYKKVLGSCISYSNSMIMNL